MSVEPILKVTASTKIRERFSAQERDIIKQYYEELIGEDEYILPQSGYEQMMMFEYSLRNALRQEQRAKLKEDLG